MKSLERISLINGSITLTRWRGWNC